MKILEIENLKTGYNKKLVSQKLNINIHRGMITGIIGPNGSGKTTLLRTLTKVIAAKEGKVLYQNKNILDYSYKQLSNFLSAVYSKQPSPGLLTVREVISLGRYPYTNSFFELKDKDYIIINRTIEQFNLRELEFHLLTDISDGERQKVIIAKSIVQEPEIFILDEPIIHLDLKHQQEILKILFNISRQNNIFILLSIHDIDLAKEYCDSIIMLKNGEVFCQGSTEEVLTHNKIEKLFDLNVNRNNEKNLMSSDGTLKNIFIIAGAATAEQLFRKLSKLRYHLTTGILHENDIDYYFAKKYNVDVISEKSFKNISPINFNEAIEAIAKTDIVIQTDYPKAELNKGNDELLEKALEMNKTIYTFKNIDKANNKVIKFNDFNLLYYKLVQDSIIKS